MKADRSSMGGSNRRSIRFIIVITIIIIIVIIVIVIIIIIIMIIRYHNYAPGHISVVIPSDAGPGLRS